jgi:choline dehydrogenase-like flavoprotein
MLGDARTLASGQSVDTDVCIIGAGAAGITLARELTAQPFRVCLLESGGLEPEPQTQSLYRGESVDMTYFALDQCRLRYFGGSTNHWAGNCWPLDPLDFEKREWVPYSGWPFKRQHLDPYYERAQGICELGPYRYDPEFWVVFEQFPLLPLGGAGVVTRMCQISPPTHFGSTYRAALAAAENVSVLLHANVVEIDTDEAGRTVTRVQVRTLEGKQFSVAAKIFVLATGGVENARLLLLSDRRHPRGLGNEHGLVGRFFMEHVCSDVGYFLPANPSASLALYHPHSVNGSSVRGHLGFREDVLRREGLLSATYVLGRLVTAPGHWEASKAETSWRVLKRALRERKLPDRFTEHLANVLSTLDVFGGSGAEPGNGGETPVQLFALQCQYEQAPNPESRVTLGSQRDALGQRRVVLDWRLTEIDRRMIEHAPRVLATELGRAGAGRVRLEQPVWENGAPVYGGASHHMGTTRMHDDPTQGVVDAQCRVHGVANLFIAGSSVFPTVGYVNPTLTIVALALRLAGHVKEVMA